MKPLAACLCLLALLPLALTEPLKFVDCGSPDGNTLVVDVSPCPTQPCQLKKGDTYLVNITFSSAVDTQKSIAIVHGIVKMIPIPFSIPEADGCKSGISCPIQHGKNYNYVAKLPIKTSYPCIELAVKWELTDDDNKDMFCWKIPVAIVN